MKKSYPVMCIFRYLESWLVCLFKIYFIYSKDRVTKRQRQKSSRAGPEQSLVPGASSGFSRRYRAPSSGTNLHNFHSHREPNLKQSSQDSDLVPVWDVCIASSSLNFYATMLTQEGQTITT